MDHCALTTRVTERPQRPASRRLTVMFIAGTSPAYRLAVPMTDTNLAATSAVAQRRNAPHRSGATAFEISQINTQGQRTRPARGVTRLSLSRGIHP